MQLGGNAIFDVEKYEREHGAIETVYVSCIVERFLVPIVEEPVVIPVRKQKRFNLANVVRIVGCIATGVLLAKAITIPVISMGVVIGATLYFVRRERC